MTMPSPDRTPRGAEWAARPASPPRTPAATLLARRRRRLRPRRATRAPASPTSPTRPAPAADPIYVHFGSKAELFAATLRANADAALDHVLGALDRPDAASLLTAFGSHLADTEAGHGTLMVQAIIAARHDRAIADLVARTFAERERGIARLIERDQRSRRGRCPGLAGDRRPLLDDRRPRGTPRRGDRPPTHRGRRLVAPHRHRHQHDEGPLGRCPNGPSAAAPAGSEAGAAGPAPMRLWLDAAAAEVDVDLTGRQRLEHLRARHAPHDRTTLARTA